MSDRHTKRELVEKYLRTCWIIKIRLISSRRTLWAEEVSLIHLENSCLQIRKICEGLAYLCVISADIKYDEIPSLRKEYKVGKVFKALKSKGKLHFPPFARLIDNGQIEPAKTSWHLNFEPVQDADIDRVEKMHERAGNVLHEFSPYRDIVGKDDAAQVLLEDLNSIKADHQWIWNRFWQHGGFVDGHLFFVNFGENSDSRQPTLIKTEGYLDEEIEINFSPDYVADFTGMVDWKQFDK